MCIASAESLQPHSPRQQSDALAALTACVRVPLCSCSVGLNTLVPALAATLGSSNDKIRGVGIRATDALVAAVDPVLLIQVGGRAFVLGQGGRSCAEALDVYTPKSIRVAA